MYGGLVPRGRLERFRDSARGHARWGVAEVVVAQPLAWLGVASGGGPSARGSANTKKFFQRKTGVFDDGFLDCFDVI